jgi:predicted ArsR family transcriptional regulator
MAKRKRKPVGPITELVRKGKTDTEIMAELGIKSKATLVKRHYQEMVAAGKVRPIPKPTRGRPKTLSREMKVGKRGTVTVKANLVEMFGFKPGATFEVKKTKAGILLKKK